MGPRSILTRALDVPRYGGPIDPPIAVENKAAVTGHGGLEYPRSYAAVSSVKPAVLVWAITLDQWAPDPVVRHPGRRENLGGQSDPYGQARPSPGAPVTPKYGGPDLDPAPDCLPGAHGEAKRYLTKLLAALDQPGWSKSQRIRLHDRYRKWLLRAEGRDPHFERYGTFPRFPGTAPPTVVDLIVARRRKRFPKTPEQRKAERLPRTKRLQQQRRLQALRAERHRRKLEDREPD